MIQFQLEPEIKEAFLFWSKIRRPYLYAQPPISCNNVSTILLNIRKHRNCVKQLQNLVRSRK